MLKKLFLRMSIVSLLLSSAITLPFVSVGVSAQGTAMPQTTLSAAIDNSIQSAVIQVTSADGFTVGNLAYIDREVMLIKSISTTFITVQRARNGTTLMAHPIGSVVFTAPPSAFYSYTPPSGPCTSSQIPYLPWINTATGDILSCKDSVWTQQRLGGYTAFGPRLAANGASAMTYTAAGAITIQPGTVFLNGTTLAMTLADPTTSQNGMVMTIMATNASAHTVTYTAGFNGGTTSRDVATFGGAVGDNLVIQAVNGVWWVISTRNVTLA